MDESKLTLNAFTIVVLIFSAILFAFTMGVAGLSDNTAINDFYPIEGTDYAIVYSNRKPNGIYEGSEQTGTLKLEGSFGHDWGIALHEPYLYVNEYTFTAMGLIHSQLVRIDLRTFEKEILFEDAVLRGTCASGELVCITGYLMPATFPETNAMSTLYTMTAAGIQHGGEGSRVIFIDPASSETVYETDLAADESLFEETYIEPALAEIEEEVGT